MYTKKASLCSFSIYIKPQITKINLQVPFLDSVHTVVSGFKLVFFCMILCARFKFLCFSMD